MCRGWLRNAPLEIAKALDSRRTVVIRSFSRTIGDVFILILFLIFFGFVDDVVTPQLELIHESA